MVIHTRLLLSKWGRATKSFGHILAFFGKYLFDFITRQIQEPYKQKRLAEKKRGKIYRQINLALLCFSILWTFAYGNGY